MKKSRVEDLIKIYSLELRIFLLELQQNLNKYNIDGKIDNEEDEK